MLRHKGRVKSPAFFRIDMKDYRDARTGKYMKKEKALADKDTSVAETRKTRRKPKKEKPNEEVNVEEAPVEETPSTPVQTNQEEQHDPSGEDSEVGAESSQETEDKVVPEFDENDKLNLPVSFIYKGDRFLQGEDVYETEPEAQEAILKKLLKMMGEE